MHTAAYSVNEHTPKAHTRANDRKANLLQQNTSQAEPSAAALRAPAISRHAAQTTDARDGSADEKRTAAQTESDGQGDTTIARTDPPKENSQAYNCRTIAAHADIAKSQQNEQHDQHRKNDAKSAETTQRAPITTASGELISPAKRVKWDPRLQSESDKQNTTADNAAARPALKSEFNVASSQAPQQRSKGSLEPRAPEEQNVRLNESNTESHDHEPKRLTPETMGEKCELEVRALVSNTKTLNSGMLQKDVAVGTTVANAHLDTCATHCFLSHRASESASEAGYLAHQSTVRY
jgi:hypothetical protein